MKRNKNNLKQTLIQVSNKLILQDIEDAKNKKNKNKYLNTKETFIKDKDEKILRNAYKNVINVINNFLDNIEDEKTNGKVNVFGTHRIIENITKNTNSNKIKRPIKKIISYDTPKIKFTLNEHNAKTETFESVNNTLKSPLKLSLNWKYQKDLLHDSNTYTERSRDELNSSILSSTLIKKNQNKKFEPKKNSFFKPKNKLLLKWNSTKNNKSNKSIFMKNQKKPIVNKNSIDINKLTNNYSSSLSSFSNINNSKNSLILKAKNNSSIIDDDENNYHQINTSNSNTTMILKDNYNDNDTYNNEANSPFSNVKVKIKNNDSEQSSSQYYLDNKNNENTADMSLLTEELLNIKKKNEIKKMIYNENDITKIISLKPMTSNLVKSFYKEKKYRCLHCKGYVYDSLDDEEESDEEDINIFYLMPNSLFLYIFDSITLISCFIILFYLPIYLAKRLYFCKDIRDKNEIIFYSIDAIYIVDLILNFFRSYYNFDENLVKKNIKIFIHYFKTWLFFDLISSIPIYTIIKTFENKCIENNYYNDPKLNNNGMHSHYYNINLNNLHYILLLIKVIRTLKIFKKNNVVYIIKKNYFKIDFLNNWGKVLLYVLFFFSFLNYTACIFIFLGRNIIDSWIFLDGLEEKTFINIYIGAVYYLVMTVTTVGYGDVIGKSIKEVLFQIIMIMAGTCIYSWLLSSVSSYVKKMNEKNVKYEEKLNILEEIRLSNHINEKLYNKILRLINYRKYHEEETEKNVILESLPNSLKNTLLIEMYKIYINNFFFFKDIENREFIVQVISKLNPIIGIKGDILIQEGEYIEEIIFIKNGILSLEVWIDMNSPSESIQNYLYENDFINSIREPPINKSSSKISNKSSSFSLISRQNGLLNTTFNHYFEKIDNKNEKALYEKKKKLKILNIRKNEHFGDVQMFLNKKSPLYVRVCSRKADLLFLKKYDAINISDKYPDIWKTVIKKPLENSKIISNLTLKTLTTFCNLNGIKTKIFRKKKNNNQYPRYYLKPSINRKKKINKNKTRKKSSEKEIKKNKTEDMHKKSIKKINFNQNFSNKNVVMSNYKKSSFSFNGYIKDNQDYNRNNLDNKNKNIPNWSSFKNNKNNNYTILISNSNDIKENNNLISSSDNNIISSSAYNNKNKYNDEDNHKNNQKDNNISNLDFIANDEILPNENFNIKIYEDEKPKSNMNNLLKILPDNIYINHLNINYLGLPLEKKENVEKKLEKKIFNNLNIFSNSNLEINSSYENINEITSNKYISDYELRKETKNFLLEKCKMSNLKIEKNSNIFKSKPFHLQLHQMNNKMRINKSLIHNKIYLLNNKKTFEQNEQDFIRKTCTNDPNNQLTNEAINIFKKKINKSHKYNNKFLKNTSSSSFDLNILKPNENIEFNNNIDVTDYENNNYNKPITKKSFKKYGDNNNIIRKRKKLKELEIITSNIQQTSQNLNQPEVFYAGLFNNLIKDYPKIKETPTYFNIKNNINNNPIDNKELKEKNK